MFEFNLSFHLNFTAPSPSNLTIHMSALTPLITRRWSPYAFNSARRVEPEKLMACFEAARWAPSSYNEQPWHFAFADKHIDSDAHAKFLAFMVEFNQQWAQHAPVLAIVSTHRESELFMKPNPHAEYDCGAAVAFFTVQATELGLSVHQMAGFDPIKATQELALPDGYAALTIFAVGYGADDCKFLPEFLQERQEKQKGRVRKDLALVAEAAQFKQE